MEIYQQRQVLRDNSLQETLAETMRIIAFICIGLAQMAVPLLFGQTAQAKRETRTFQVRGTIRDPLGDVFPGIDVVFASREVTRKLVTDGHGFYDVQLPAGLYTMTAQASETIPGYRFLEKYRRPTFQVGTSNLIKFDITLNPARMTCDMVTLGDPPTPEVQEELAKDACGGEDLFDIPSQWDPTLQLYIRFLRRLQAGQKREYSGDIVANPNVYAPVRIEYNLFTLEAKHVIYDPK